MRTLSMSQFATKDDYYKTIIGLKDAEITELKKKNGIGQINEAYAVTIENQKIEISKLKQTVNKLRQNHDN